MNEIEELLQQVEYLTGYLRHAQEAQGAQAGDEHQGKYWAFRNENGELCITDRWDVAKHIPFDVINLVDRAALAIQPAAQDDGPRAVGPTHPYREEC